jgi:medium-chain acyl-[acyl-carrier-protein] hydrolase
MSSLALTLPPAGESLPGSGITRDFGAASWFYRPLQGAGSCFRLYCFPYAGGGATMFRSWAELMPEVVEVVGIGLPGRGARIMEPPVSDLDALADGIAHAIIGDGSTQFAFFGHSMGALLAFEVARRLRRVGAKQPRHLFMSGAEAPHLRAGRKAIGSMSEDEFLNELRELNGTPEALLRDRAMLELFLPVLKADFIALERWTFRQDRPLDVPITAIGGRSDPHVGVDAARSWEAHTRADFNFRIFEGDHFFVHHQEASIVGMIVGALQAEGAIG